MTIVSSGELSLGTNPSGATRSIATEMGVSNTATLSLDNPQVKNLSVTEDTTSLSFSTFYSKTQPKATNFPRGGSYSWICPSGVTSISVVCIGRGGQGGNGGGSGGGGGALALAGTVPVQPGAIYTVNSAGSPTSPYGPGQSSFANTTGGILIAATSGAQFSRGTATATPASIPGSTTVHGSNGGFGGRYSNGIFTTGGGGAGGYSSDGNNGGNGAGGNGQPEEYDPRGFQPASPSVGGGAGGSGWDGDGHAVGGGGVSAFDSSRFFQSQVQGGTDPAPGPPSSGAQPGGAGTRGSNGAGLGYGGNYGGGSGSNRTGSQPGGPFAAAGGAGYTRIIWGPGRNYAQGSPAPSTVPRS